MFSHLLAFRVFGNAKVLIGEVGCCLVLTGLALYASCRCVRDRACLIFSVRQCCAAVLRV